jgi:SAM-dependent methyltransferase
MDSPDLDEGCHRRALDALGRINRWSGCAPRLWAEVRPAASRPQGEGPLRILDVACGGGDVALRLERLARRDGVAVRLHGCDASAVAVARAREQAAVAGSTARFSRLDVLREPLPAADVVYSTLFLHHLDEQDAERLLAAMAAAARRMVVVQDLDRSIAGLGLAVLGVYLLTRSSVARVDGPRSVRAAYRPREALALARRAGLQARVRRCWPQRYSLVWEPS